MPLYDKICNRHISKEEAEKILNGKKVILNGFSTSDEKIFRAVRLKFVLS